VVDGSLVFFLKEELQKGYGYVPISIHQSDISEGTIKQFLGLESQNTETREGVIVDKSVVEVSNRAPDQQKHAI
jgi:hypothetical protein